MNRGRGRNSRGFYRPRGRSSSSGGNSAHHKGPVRADEYSGEVHLGRTDKLSHIRGHTSGDLGLPAVENISIDLENLKLVHNAPDAVCTSDFPLSSAQSDHVDKHLNVRKTPKEQTSYGESENRSSSHFDCSSVVDSTYVPTEFSQLAKSAIKDLPSKEGTECGETSNEKTIDTGRSETSDWPFMEVPFDTCREKTGTPANLKSLQEVPFMEDPFDICREKTGTPAKLKTSLLVLNREKRNEIKRLMEGQKVSTLRPGMVLLKRYISCRDQVKIVKTCRQLGLGSGGFYQPGYRDGAKLLLKMMCLGKNWDPETSKYGEQRQVDGAKPPLIPSEFHQLVKKAIQDSHASPQKGVNPKDVESILPTMSPDICIVNFYTNSGRLGLHQDKDESSESLNNGLSVVSISIGDSAEFLYGDQRDIDKAEKVILESGDVLIFGGKSRLIFHGVTSILPNTAPEPLLEESNLRPGRLNLTFRKY